MKEVYLVALALCALRLSAQAPLPIDDASWWQPTAKANKEMNWLQLSGSYRVRFEDQDGIAFGAGSDTHILGQLWFGAKIQPLDWLSFFGQGQDSRIYLNGVVTKNPPHENSLDLHQAWVQLGNLDKYHFALRVGRQILQFGDQRLVGPSPWLNAPRVFDAAVGTVSFSGWRLDAFASSVVNSVNEQLDHHKQGNPFYGVYQSFTHLVPKATIEPYLFWRFAPLGYTPAYANGAKGHFDESTVGFRWVGKLPDNFDYGAEMARQDGTIGVDSISAWAGHWVVGRTFNVKLKPRALFEYNYASGTANPTSTHIGTFDQLYPSGHDKFGETDQVGWRNIRDIRTGAEFKASAKLTFSGIYHDFWLADARDGLYAATGALVAKSLSGVAGTHVGRELDAQGVYTFNKALQAGAGFGHLFPGEFLQKTTPGRAYNYPYLMVTYSF